jgi:Uncharacterized protein conserved in bacteria (DUF2252)
MSTTPLTTVDPATPAPGSDALPVEQAPTVRGRAEHGRSRRSELPRSRQGQWTPASTRDPVGILVEQEESRVPELVPIRHGRMAQSPFAFYRGAAAVMAADLATVPSTGLTVQLCGDAHLVNFGGFADPGRQIIFDVNDFDETAAGPFEWDVKRLVASIEVAARERGLNSATRHAAVTACANEYRVAMREFASSRLLDVWYARLDPPTIRARWGDAAGGGAWKRLEEAAAKARTKDNLKAMAKLTRRVNGEIRFASQPPLLEPVSDVFPDVAAARIYASVSTAMRAYRRNLPRSRQRLFDGYRFVDLARKVVGVGSVGTRCWVALLLGRDDDDPIMIQVKQAEESVVGKALEWHRYRHQGQRVVEGQEVMQAASDILLGWARAEGPDGVVRDFYLRQLWDWKASANLEAMPPELMGFYGRMCAWTLARAHAKTGDAVAIASYLGGGSRFDDAMARFAAAYADQNERDYHTFTDAIASGMLSAVHDI